MVTKFFERRILLVVTSCVSFCALGTLIGCNMVGTASGGAVAGIAFEGRVHGGQSPVIGSHIFLYAANQTGYQTSSISRLSGVGFAVSDASGGFTITALNNCQAGDLVYALASGGNPGLAAGTNNTALRLMAALGPCSALTPSTFISINEATTVAATYALAQFMADDTHVGTSASNVTGLASAFATAGNLASATSGATLLQTPGGNGTVPQAELNSLANSIAVCVNSDGTGPPCATLFANTTLAGGPAPSNTVSAALNVALAPTANVAAVYLLGMGTGAPFQPSLTTAPTDWTVTLRYTANVRQPSDVAVDAQGNVWVTDSNSLSQLSPTGNVLLANKMGGGISNSSLPIAVAVDLANFAWTANETGNSISNFSDTGSPLSGTGFTGGGLNEPLAVAIDGAGKIWIANIGANSISKFNPDGSAISPASGFLGGGSANTAIFGVDIAIDGSGFAWILNGDGTLSRLNNDGSMPIRFQNTATSIASHLAIDASHNIWFTSGPIIRKVDQNGNVLVSWIFGTDNISSSSQSIAIDGNGDAWIANGGIMTITRITGTGGTVSNYAIPGSGNGPSAGIAPDPSGNIWVGDKSDNVVFETVGLAAPTTTPLSIAIKNGKLATRP